MKEIRPHTKGIYETSCGSIRNKETGCLVDQPAALVDPETGSVLRIGNEDGVQEDLIYYTEIYKALHDSDPGIPDYGKNLTLVRFASKWEAPGVEDRSGAEFSKDEVCTMMNYMMDHAGKKRLQELFRYTAEQMHEEMKKLYESGW